MKNHSDSATTMVHAVAENRRGFVEGRAGKEEEGHDWFIVGS
jgi:hypothetical protein